MMRTTFLLLAGAVIGSVATWLVVGARTIPTPTLFGDFVLSPEQKAVHAWLLDNANEPETLWIERWEPAQAMPRSRLGSRYYHGDADDNNLGACDRSVRLKYRETVPLKGRVRREIVVYLDGLKVIASDDIAFVICTIAEDQKRIAEEKADPQRAAAMKAYKEYWGR